MKKRLRSALAVTLFLFTYSPLVQAESAVQPVEIQQLSSPTESPATAIPFAEIGAKATADYQGDAIGIEATADGARLRTGFQKLAGTVTAEGLQLESTAEKEGQLKLTAAALRRGAGLPTVLPARGSLSSTDKVVAFIRPGIIEEYSVSVDGLRQDFIVTQRPEGAGDLSLELALTGAAAEAASYGAKLTLDGSGRTLAYSRLHVTDAKGKELTATMEVLAHHRLAIRVEDAGAAYPLRIDPTFSDADWVSLNSGIPGANGAVNAAVVDGSGNLYIGGDFTLVGSVLASRIAKWDGSAWSALGTGMSGSVLALVMSGTDLYAGGSFTTAGGVSASRIAKWNGSGWSALGTGMNFGVTALAVSGMDLYAGGGFTTAGGVSANCIAKWDGSVWSALGTGMNDTINALVVSGSDIFAGGYFTTAGGISANLIAKWNGSVWSGLGTGLDGGTPGFQAVFALAASGSDLYAGGTFSTAGGVNIGSGSVAKWNGSSWSGLTGLGQFAQAIAVVGTDVYAGTNTGVSRWNGSAWSAVGTGMNSTVKALAVNGGDIYAAGLFTTASGLPAQRIAKWNGSAWSAFGAGMDGNVQALAVNGSDLYAGGGFITAGGVTVNRIAKWDGSVWSALGTGMNDVVLALAVRGSDLYAGGFFTTADGVTVNRVAKWDGSAWSPLDTGMSSIVRDLEVSGTDLYAGGEFITAGGVSANRIAKWNGSVWSALGTGMDGSVYQLALSGSDLYVGGGFTTAGGVTVNRIAKWNGSVWSALGAGMSSTVRALEISGTDLYAGGDFTTAGGVTVIRIAKWNGSVWSALGTGLNGTVSALAISGTDLYAGGSFTTAGGLTANRIAKWDGSTWSALGSGVDSSINALAVGASGHLFLGGNFTFVGTTTVSPFIAQANLPPPAPTVVSIAPSTGGTAGGTSVTITGTNFSGTPSVTIGSVAATSVVVVDANTITCLTPAGTGTAKDVVVTVSGEPSTGGTGLFSYDAPTVASIAPTSGSTAGGTIVTITGTNFGGTPSVTIGGNPATSVVVNSATSITCATPAGTAGARDVVVTVSGQLSTGGTGLFTYVAPPTVASIAPTSGSTAGGTTVTITGTNFGGTPSVTIGGNPATSVVVNSATSITCATPAGTAGAKDVVVTVSGQSSTGGTGLYTYVAPPTVTASTANLLTTATTLTITGTGFSTTPGDNTVAFSPAGTGTVTASTATSLTVTSLTGLTLGALNAVVTTNSLSSGAAVQVATVVAPAPGTLDLPFNPNVTGGSGYVTATAILPDGRMIIGGNFTTVGGAPHANIARLNADGSVDATFTTSTNSDVRSVAVQADGKLVLGGTFTSVNGSPLSTTTGVNWIARLNADGTRDTAFNAGLGGANGTVNSVVVQADGKLVLGGDFTIMNGSTVNRIARLNADGTLDTAFNAGLGGANATVWSIAVQADGKLVIGGSFTSVNGSPVSTTTGVNRIARLNADGTRDTAFNAGLGGASDAVTSVAVQADGKLLLGGFFLSVNGTTSNSTTGVNRIARLNADGTRDTAFNAGLGGANGAVYSVALQADGKLVLGGNFTTVNGSTVNRIARLNADGTRDTAFNAGLGGANSGVNSVAVRADGKLVFGGTFTSVNGTTRNALALLTNDAATQSLSAPYTTQVVWTRGGAGPELGEVTFEQSTDGGSSWTHLGAGTRVGSTSNWRRTGLSLPNTGHLRARGRTTSGYLNGGSGLIEQVASFTTTAPPDYTVTTTGNAIVVTDNIGNGDVLTVSQPSAGNIRFAAPGRTFSVDGGAFITGDSGDLSRTNVTSITVNADAGNDTINIGAFTGTLPSLTINGDADADTVNLNGDVTFTAGAGLSVTGETLTLAAGVDMTTSGAGTIMISADDMVIASTGTLVSASTVNLKPQTAAWEIDLGTNTAGKLGLTDTELDRVTAGTLIVGDAACGQITLSTAIGPAGTTTLSLITGAGVTQASTDAKITETHLAVRAVNSVSLDQGSTGRHAISTLAARSTGGGIGLRSSLALTVGTVDGLNGLNAGAGGALAYAENGNLLIQQPIVATGGVSLTAWQTGALLNISADVTSGGTVTLGGDRMIINNPVAATSSCTVFGADTLDLGSATDAAAATTEISDAELDFITIVSPTGILNLQTNGDIVVSAALTLGSKKLRLSTSVGTIDFNGGSITTTSDIDLYGEFVTADASGTDVTANKIFSFAKTFGTAANPLRTTVGNLSIDQFQGGGGVRTGIYILETDSVSLTNNGLKSTNAPISLTTSDGSVTLSFADVVTTGTVSLTAGGAGGTLSVSGDDISGSAVSLTADNMTIGSTASITASTGAVTLAPTTPGRPIDLGTNTASQLGLTEAELDRITAGTLSIGDASSGAITLSSAISRAASTNVNLNSGSNIAITTGSIDTAGGDFDVNPGGVNNTFSSAASGTDVSMSTTGTLRFGSGDKLGINFSSTTVAQSLSVVGNVNLNGAVPSFTGSAPDVVGTFTLIDNDDSDAITGAFTGLAEGATLSVNGTPKVISYVGGTGNDVVITPLSNVATLANLVLTTATLNTGFSSGITSYTSSVPNATLSVTATPTVTHAGATVQIRVNGGAYSAVASTFPSGPLALLPGPNPIDVLVTAQNGTTTLLYTVVVTRTATSPVSSAVGDVVTANDAPDETGANSGLKFDVLRRGGYLSEDGKLVFPGYLLNVGGPAMSGVWKDDGTGVKLLALTGNNAPETGTTLATYDVLPQTPAINDSGEVTFLASLAVGSGTPVTTVTTDTALWSEIGSAGLSILMRESDSVPTISGATIGAFASGCFATAHTSGTTGEAAFAITMKGATTDTAILRASVSSTTTAVQVVARENTATGVGSENFGNLAGGYTDSLRMDATGNLAFVALTKPSARESLWYQPAAPSGSAATKVFMAGTAATGDVAPGTGGATFRNIKSPTIGSGGVISFRGQLNLNGDNATNSKNDGIWRGTGSNAASYQCILRRGDDNTNRAGFGLPAGAKVGNLWGGWLTNGNRGAWRGWLDVNGNGVSSTADGDVNAIYSDLSGVMKYVVRVGGVDDAPGMPAGAKFAAFDLPVVGGAEQMVFLGNVTGGGTTAANNSGIWRSASNGGALSLVVRTGDVITTTQGAKTIRKVDFPASEMTDRRWEQPIMDSTGRLIVFVTFTDGTTSHLIVP